MSGKRAVFLDRDGVLTVPEFRDGRSFAPRRLEDFRLYEDAQASVEKLKAHGFAVIVVTNQPDVGKGLMTAGTLDAMHGRMQDILQLDAIEVCTHTNADNCGCRKPRPGMILSSAYRLDIDLPRSYLVGDRVSDIEAGRAGGCKTVFIDLAYTAEGKPANPDAEVKSLAQAVDWILKDSIGMDS